MGYSMDPDPETTAKAYWEELQISPKKSNEVCNMVKGKDVDRALDMLEEVIEGDRAVPYEKHHKGVGHQKGAGPGGYPKKVSEEIRSLIEECRANAENKGLDSENMRIKLLAAHKGSPIQGFRSRAFGRSSPSDTKTTNLEIILEEKEE
ncbi:MAG: 50S ribosomal protein L22 [Candidatus Thermoplasmatota archaeon]|nr:50S ribosomal protein L22 [Candidatus Thermoplasmatota archaeon]